MLITGKQGAGGRRSYSGGGGGIRWARRSPGSACTRHIQACACELLMRLASWWRWEHATQHDIACVLQAQMCRAAAARDLTKEVSNFSSAPLQRLPIHPEQPASLMKLVCKSEEGHCVQWPSLSYIQSLH